MFDMLNRKDITGLAPKSDFIYKRVFKEINKNMASGSSD